MRQQLLDLIDTMIAAHETIKKESKNGPCLTVFRLLEDCQTSAIRIGDTLEQDNDTAEAVRLLEEYCELVYGCGQALESGEALTKQLKAMQKRLLRLRDYLQYQIKTGRLEIAFLPYKFSMWDSLESIWKAAREDPECDAYVIPIPYYDKNPDGSLGDMHEEGGLYPNDVPVTDWRSYSIGERRPDIIFIHNPYDNQNRVTSVHPDFYAEKLKNYTDLLVYVPYFICLEDVPAHFCVCPGTVFADLVIVQSEKVRNTYKKEFRRFEKANRLEGDFYKAEKKILALGSPKSDKAQLARREDYPLSESWSSKILRGDGSSKKIVFYNTTIDALLNYREILLDKIESVIEQFRENADEFVLLWRPHPLLESTVHSMLPHLMSRYRQIVSRFQEEGWGIYDDSGELYRAIALSDAYYGDWSSVVALYRLTGKPIMIQDPQIL